MGSTISKCVFLDLASVSLTKLLVAGGVVHINVLGKHIVILNRLEDAKELLEKRSQIYSDRPTMPMIELYVGILHPLD